MKKKLEHCAVVTSMILIIGMFLLLMFWWLYPYKTVVINQQPYIVFNKAVKQGDNVNYLVDSCNFTDIVPTVKKQFVDGIIYSVPKSDIRLPKGCHKSIISVKVPKSLPVGEYKLKIFIEFQVNPLRKITTEYETENFTVIK